MNRTRTLALSLAAGVPLLSLALLANAQDAPTTAPTKTTTPSGLTIVDQGRDDVVVRAGDTVTVHYTGKFEDGAVFDSSLRPDRAPFIFQVGAGRVIAGWDEGLVGMRPGERRQLVVPGKLAYGERGSPPRIPPNATLVFDIQLLYVSRPAGDAAPAR